MRVGRIADLYDNWISSYYDIESMERTFYKESSEVLFGNDGWRIRVGWGIVVWVELVDIAKLLSVELVVVVGSFLEWSDKCSLVVWVH